MENTMALIAAPQAKAIKSHKIKNAPKQVLLNGEEADQLMHNVGLNYGKCHADALAAIKLVDLSTKENLAKRAIAFKVSHIEGALLVKGLDEKDAREQSNIIQLDRCDSTSKGNKKPKRNVGEQKLFRNAITAWSRLLIEAEIVAVKKPAIARGAKLAPKVDEMKADGWQAETPNMTVAVSKQLAAPHVNTLPDAFRYMSLVSKQLVTFSQENHSLAHFEAYNALIAKFVQDVAALPMKD